MTARWRADNGKIPHDFTTILIEKSILSEGSQAWGSEPDNWKVISCNFVKPSSLNRATIEPTWPCKGLFYKRSSSLNRTSIHWQNRMISPYQLALTCNSTGLFHNPTGEISASKTDQNHCHSLAFLPLCLFYNDLSYVTLCCLQHFTGSAWCRWLTLNKPMV